jgi:hypothetical protein
MDVYPLRRSSDRFALEPEQRWLLGACRATCTSRLYSGSSGDP